MLAAADDRIRIGVDLGGTKIEIIALDIGGGELLRRRIPTPRDGYEATLGAVADLVRRAMRELGEQFGGQAGREAATVGMGTPGSLSSTGILRNSNSVCLNGRSLQRDLEALLGFAVRVANDANCFALSEAVDGAGAGSGVVFGVILGTGVGGGIVVDGRVLSGANGVAGEWGHNPLPLPAGDDLPLPACYCGRAGCIETYLSGAGLVRDHRKACCERLSAEEIAKRALAGDENCEAALRRYEARLARALAQVINLLDPDVIVLGGGLSNLGRLYASVPQLWAPHVFSDNIVTRLLRNRHGDSSGVRGAARLWDSPGAHASE
ncbi:MAG: ROK family protein [Burkholderiales bacterium]|nr:ROK family protein [Pseudomonadota bacterium]